VNDDNSKFYAAAKLISATKALGAPTLPSMEGAPHRPQFSLNFL